VLLFGLLHTTSIKDDCANYGAKSFEVRSDIFNHQTQETGNLVTEKMRGHSFVLGKMADSPDAHIKVLCTVSPLSRALDCDKVLDASRCYQKNGDIDLSGTSLLYERGRDVVFDLVRLMHEFASYSEIFNG
jgi:hypothetical protein